MSQRIKGCWRTTWLREDRVEVLVIQKIEAIDDPKQRTLNKLRAALEVVNPQEIGMYRQKMLNELGAQIARMKTMESNLYDDRLAGFITKEKYEEKRRQFARQATEIAERTAMLSESQNARLAVDQELQSDNQIIDLYFKSTPNQKRIIISIIFKKIVAKEGRPIFVSN